MIWVDRQGRRSPLLETKEDFAQPKFSPDGKRFAIRVGDNLKVFEVESGRSIQLTREGGTGSPVWTPDGKRIAFASRRNDQFGIYWRASDGSGEEELLWQGPSRSSPISWHPNGQVLAIMTINPTTKFDILLLSLPERRITPFLNEPFSESEPRFSPDGRWVAYYSDETGQLEVYVRPYPGPGGKIPISRGGGADPKWAANGRELFYWQGVGAVDKLFVVDVKTAPEFIAGTPRELFGVQGSMFYDVAPNGQRFAITVRERLIAQKQLNVVLNWTEELKRLVPTWK